jgi:hypothetical protein
MKPQTEEKTKKKLFSNKRKRKTYSQLEEKTRPPNQNIKIAGCCSRQNCSQNFLL